MHFRSIILIPLFIALSANNLLGEQSTKTLVVGGSKQQAHSLSRGIANVGRVDDLLKEYDSQIDTGNYQEVIPALKQMVDDESTNPFQMPDVLRVLVKGLRKAGDLPEANIYQTKMLLYPTSDLFFLNEGNILRDIVEKYTASGGTNPKLRTLELSVTEEDIALHNEIYDKDQSTPRKQKLELGDFYRRRMHLDEAETLYKEGLVTPAQKTQIPHELGIFYWTSTEDDIEDFGFYVRLRAIYLFEGRYDEAIKANQKIMEGIKQYENQEKLKDPQYTDPRIKILSDLEAFMAQASVKKYDPRKIKYDYTVFFTPVYTRELKAELVE